MKILAKGRKALNKAMAEVLKPTYFECIPIDRINAVLRAAGLKLLQEDGTPWSGFLCGAASETLFEVGDGNGRETVVEDAHVRLAWYKMPSGRYEITGYVC